MSNNLKRAYTMKKLFILIAFPLLFQSCTFINSDFKIIELAQEIQKKYNVSNNKYVTIINYGKSILSNRLYLVDMQKNEIILRTTVSHAWNSGLVYPTKFSNEKKSEKSSIGAFKTMDSYYGKNMNNGLSFKGLHKKMTTFNFFDGLEKVTKLKGLVVAY